MRKICYDKNNLFSMEEIKMQSIVRSAYFSDDSQKRTIHYHDCHQIIFITQGQIQLTVNHQEQTVSEGNLILLSRYENHSVQILSKEYKRYILRLDPFADQRENKIYTLLSNRPSGFHHILSVADQAAVFETLFDRIVAECHNDQIFSEEMKQLLINELLIMIYRLIPEATAVLDAEGIETVFDIQRRFERYFSEPYSLEGLAKEYNISPSSLSHRFKKITGSSVMDYLLSCRLASAKNDLTKSNLRISEIVERCGFSDNSNFSRTFKKQNGLSPSQFRKKYKL